MAATVESTFRIVNDASRTLKDVKNDAEAADRALLRMGASGDLASRQVGGGNSTTNYSNAERALKRLEDQNNRTGNSFGFLQSKIVLISAAVMALSPVLEQSAGILVQWVGSLVNAVGGAGIIGGGLLGAFAVGLGATAVVVKGMMGDLSTSQQLFTSYNQAIATYGRNSQQAALAASRLNQELKLAPDGTLTLLNNLKALGIEWDNVTTKAQNAVMAQLAYGTGQLGRALPQIANQIVNPSTQAFAGAAGSLFSRLLSPESMRTFTSLAQGFVKMIGPLVDLIGNLGQALGHLAVIALPFAEEFIKRIDQWSQGFLTSSRDVQFFHTMFATMVQQFRVWMSFFGAILHFIATFSEYAKGGSQSIGGITDALNRWSDWMQNNPAKVNAFFMQSTKMASDLGKALTFIWDLFTGLAKTMQPTWDLVRQLLGEIGPPLLKLLLAISTTISILSNAFSIMGAPNSALVITLNVITSIVTAFNWLLVHVPLLASLLSGGLLVLGLTAMATWIGKFVTGIGSSITGMLGLTNQTNAAAAATERLALAGKGVGIGGLGGLAAGSALTSKSAAGGFIVGPGGKILSGAPEAGVAGTIVDEYGNVTRSITPLGAAAGTGILARLGGIGARVGSKIGSIGESLDPYAIPAVIAAAGLSLVPSGDIAGGQRTKSVLGDTAMGAGLGALGGSIVPGLGTGIGALVGGAAGLGYGLYSHVFNGGGSGDPLVNSIMNGRKVGGHAQQRGFFSELGSHILNPFGSTSNMVGQRQIPGLSGQLALHGGTNPTTPAQYAAQITILGAAFKKLQGDQSTQAQAAVQSILQQLGALKQMQAVVDAEAKHAQFLGASRMTTAIGLGAGAVDKREGPAATLDFVREQVLSRWSSLGPEGKKLLAASVVQWAQEMDRQNPALKAEFDKIMNSPIAAILEVNGKIPTEGGKIITNMKATFDRLKAVLATPLQEALALNRANLTTYQLQMVDFYVASGWTRVQATAIVHGTLNPATLTQSGMTNNFMTLVPPGPFQSVSPAKKALGGRIGGTGFEDTVPIGGRNMAAPGELVVNQHTENLVNRMLGGRVTLGGMVGMEGRPHNMFATGGRLPDFSGITGSPLTADTLMGLFPVAAAASGSAASGGAAQVGAGSSGVAFGLRGGTPITGTGHSAMNQRMAQAMLGRYGWGMDQWPSLQALWTGESNWSEFAYNHSSGAQGIPQFLPMPGRATPAGFPSNGPINAAAQLAWGMNYIEGRYGNPSTAYSDWLGRSPHWYGAGGDFIARRPQLIGVGERGAERVQITPMSRMPSFPGGMAGGITVNVSIDNIDATGDADAVKKMVTGQIRDAIAEVSDELSRIGHVAEEHITTG